MISPTECGSLFSARTTPQPSQNLVEPSWNPRGTLVEPWWNPGGTLVELSWNLTAGPPRTTPEPIWAETPKLSAVGEQPWVHTSCLNCPKFIPIRRLYSDQEAEDAEDALNFYALRRRRTKQNTRAGVQLNLTGAWRQTWGNHDICIYVYVYIYIYVYICLCFVFLGFVSLFLFRGRSAVCFGHPFQLEDNFNVGCVVAGGSVPLVGVVVGYVSRLYSHICTCIYVNRGHVPQGCVAFPLLHIWPRWML